MPHCLYEQPDAWTANTELTSGVPLVGRAFPWVAGSSRPISTSKPPTECEEDCQEAEAEEEEESLCEVFNLGGNARAELKFLDRFLRQVRPTIAAVGVVGFRLFFCFVVLCFCFRWYLLLFCFSDLWLGFCCSRR